MRQWRTYSRAGNEIRRTTTQHRCSPYFSLFSSLALSQTGASHRFLKSKVLLERTQARLYHYGRKPPHFSQKPPPTVSERVKGISLTKTGCFCLNNCLLDAFSRCSGKHLFYWTPLSASFTYSIRSAGWHSNSPQIVLSVFQDTNSLCRSCCK